MFSDSILLGSSPSERQFVGELTDLCKSHQISCGNPQDIAHLGSDLVSNESFRVDLFTLCTAISHTAEGPLSPEQLLVLVVCAFGGSGTSIRDATIDLPQDAMSAFLDGYESWSRREPNPAADSSWHVDRDHEPVSSQPGPTLFYSSASRSGADPRGTQDDPPARHAANGAHSRREIPANTPLENLTLSELRMYLEDIENRVSRIEPRLERITPERLPPPKHFERPKDLDAQSAPEPSSTVAAQHSEPAIVRETAVPAAQAERALDATTPLIAPHQNTTVSDDRSSATHAARLRRLRLVNAVLTLLLVLLCASVAIFGYRSLHPQSVSLAPTTQRSALPLGKQSSELSPANQAAKITQQHVALSAASSIPNSIHRPDNTTSGNVVNTHPPQTSPTQPTVTPESVAHPAPQTDTEKLEPSPSQTIKTIESPPSNLPITPSAANTQDHSQARPSPSDAQPDLKSAEPVHPTTPPPAASGPLVASATSASSRPAAIPTAMSIPRPASQTNAPVAVPAAMMMTYAVLTPKPVYPSFSHLRADSTVDVEATISKDGRVTSARALNGTLDVQGAVVRAVQGWRFTPYILDGNAVAVVTTFKFVFKAH